MELNLYNFENEENNDSKYVLTSPRSLQACDKLGYKPLELLYKPLAEFQDVLLPSGLPLREIYDQYDKHESSRQRKLRECRDYRDKMIRNNLYDMMSDDKQHVDDKAEEELPAHVYYDEIRRMTPVKGNYQDEYSVDNSATLQRMRTAHTLQETRKAEYVTSELDLSAPDSKGRDTPSSAHNRSVSFVDKQDEQKPGGDKRINKTTRDRGRTASAYTSRRSARLAWSNNSYNSDDYKDYKDLSNQLTKSLHLEDLTQWRSPDMRGTYLRNNDLRRSLGYRNTTGRITPRDEKILEALHSKNEREVEEERDRSEAQLRWEEERLRHEHEKEIAEHTRRKLLALHIAEAEEAQAALKEQQFRDQEELRRAYLSKCEEHETRWRLGAEHQQYIQDLELKQKRRRSIERKKSQERLLLEHERQRDAMLQEYKVNADLNMQKAAMKKHNHDILENMRTKRKNQQEEVMHRQRYNHVKEQAKKQTEDLKTTIAQKDAVAQLNQTSVNTARDYALHMNAKERQRRFDKSRENVEKMDQAMSEWKRSLSNRRRVLEAKAKLTAAQTLELKSLRAHAEREEREAKQRQTYNKIKAERELMRQEQKDAIKYKDTKMKVVQHHKEQVIGEVRNLAATSQRLREELRRKYGKDSFDKKALETELQNRVGSGPLTGHKNKSTVILA